MHCFMLKFFTSITILFSTFQITMAQAPYIVWQRALGGVLNDDGQSVIRTTDNNIAIIGSAESNVNSPDIHNQHAVVSGTPDMWFIKFANDGTIIFNSCFGGGYDENGYSLTETRNGSIVLCGYADSNDQFVTGVHGVLSPDPAGLNDYWVVKLDSVFNVEWQRCYGSTESDEGHLIKSTRDGGFILSGKIEGFDGDVTNFHGSYDLWVVKTDSLGNIQWQTALGGTLYDYPGSLIATADGGFIIGGNKGSTNGNITCTDAQKEIWIIKLDSVGNILWDKCYGGSGVDWVNSLLPAANNGFYAACISNSTDGDITNAQGMYDGWVFKADSLGNIIWEKSFGGTDWDGFSSMTFTSDHSIVCSGGSRSPQFNYHGGDADAYVVKIDTSGNLQWQSCYGGSNDDYSNSIVEASDSSLFFVGYSTSNDGDLILNRGGQDMWVVKLESPTAMSNYSIKNPLNNLTAFISDNALKINFTSRKSGKCTISLFDITGKSVKSFNTSFQQGKNEIKDYFNVVHGIYILKFISEEGIVSKKLVY